MEPVTYYDVELTEEVYSFLGQLGQEVATFSLDPSLREVRDSIIESIAQLASTRFVHKANCTL